MGGGFYNLDNSQMRATSYGNLSQHEIFETSVKPEMVSKNIALREARDSEDHPESLPIIIGLDVTGSMGYIPEELVKGALHNLMGQIMECGIKHPQLNFLGIGDHKCDREPLQVGQFESSDDLLDKWLTGIWLEGGGGGNGGESYHLAWAFAGYKTSIDSFEKRQQKGFLFTIGDDAVHRTLSIESQTRVFGDGNFRAETATSLLEKAKELYNVYHIHIGSRGWSADTVIGDWKELLGENLIVIEDHQEIHKTIANKVAEVMGMTETNTISEVKNTTEVESDEERKHHL